MKGNCSKVRTYVFLTFYVYKTGYFLKDYVHNQEESDIHNIFWILFFEMEMPRFVFLVKCMGFISTVMMGVILGA